MLKSSLKTRFWCKVDKRSNDECWEWKGAKSHNGYGMVKVAPKITRRAHRLSWEFANGEIPDGLLVLHKCDNPKCVNPSHLFLGTSKDNAEDAKRKERWTRGEISGLSKLSQEDVLKIRHLYVPRKTSQYKLAKQFGVSRSAIAAILSGRNWVWL